ncbi:MAG: PKD domain-containing protein [Euryarchaeota archaeon]|nr:PKD domain-containing protein [Euryarchaeota archaeon]
MKSQRKKGLHSIIAAFTLCLFILSSSIPFLVSGSNNPIIIEKVDQSYWDNNDKIAGVLNQGMTIYNNFLGQSFTPTKSLLSSIDLFIFSGCFAEGDVTVKIFKAKSNGYPDLNNILTESRKTRNEFNSFTWYNFNFPDIQVIPGDTYFITVDAGIGYCWKDAYQKPGFEWVDTYPNGSSWAFLMRDDYGFVNNQWDYFFRTYYIEGVFAPVANAGSDKESIAGEPIHFSGEGSYDSDGVIVNYTWKFGDGTMGYGLYNEHIYSRSGTYTVILEVTDNDGLENCDECIITVTEPPNQPPVVIVEISGYIGRYYNLPANHTDMEGIITGVVPGDLPFNHDWYDSKYYSFERIDTSLKYGNNFFPVDEGLPGDPYYFAVHWNSTITVPTSGNYSFDIGSDDDSWVYIDDTMVCDLGGTHAFSISTQNITLTSGEHQLDIYFAERHKVQSGFYFEFTNNSVISTLILNVSNKVYIEVDDTITFDATKSYDPEGKDINYFWDFGDGYNGNGAKANHIYSTEGNYSVILNVTDDLCATSLMKLELVLYYLNTSTNSQMNQTTSSILLKPINNAPENNQSNIISNTKIFSWTVVFTLIISLFILLILKKYSIPNELPIFVISNKNIVVRLEQLDNVGTKVIYIKGGT